MIVFPLLLIFGALGGILLIVGRKLPTARGVLREQSSRAEPALDSTDAALQPRTPVVVAPRRRTVMAWRGLLTTGSRRLVTVASQGGKRGGLILMKRGASLARVFRRLPRSVPGMRETAGSVSTVGQTERGSVVPTTADVKRTIGHPLRLPEPLPQSMTPTGEKRSVEGGAPSAAAATPSPATELPASPVMEHVEENEPVHPPAPVESEAVPAMVPKVSAEVPADTPSAGPRRRVVGRVRRQSRPAQPLSAPPVPQEVPAAGEREERDVVLIPAEPGERILPVEYSDAERITALIDEGSLGRAESQLIDILSKNPRDTDAYRLLGTIYLKREDHQQAREVFEEAVRRDPGNTRLYGLLGHAYFALGEYAKALSLYQRAHDADEANIEYLERLLTILSRMDSQSLVRVTAKKILVLNPNHAEAKKTLERVGVR